MIVVDTSALMAVVLDEPDAEACSEVLASADDIADLGRHARGGADRRRAPTGRRYDGTAGPRPWLPGGARHPGRRAGVAAAYGRWGKGLHPAGLNYGDCFAYALARERECRLLLVGDEFDRTDIKPCLPAA